MVEIVKTEMGCAPPITFQNQKSFWIPSKQPPDTYWAGWAISFLQKTCFRETPFCSHTSWLWYVRLIRFHPSGSGMATENPSCQSLPCSHFALAVKLWSKLFSLRIWCLNTQILLVNIFCDCLPSSCSVLFQMQNSTSDLCKTVQNFQKILFTHQW